MGEGSSGRCLEGPVKDDNWKKRGVGGGEGLWWQISDITFLHGALVAIEEALGPGGNHLISSTSSSDDDYHLQMKIYKEGGVASHHIIMTTMPLTTIMWQKEWKRASLRWRLKISHKNNESGITSYWCLIMITNKFTIIFMNLFPRVMITIMITNALPQIFPTTIAQRSKAQQLHSG